jgi:hypothetical protein
MMRVVLYNIVLWFSAVMMLLSFITLFACTSDGQLMSTTCSFLGWGIVGTILICTRK